MGKVYSFEKNKAIGILITDYDLGEITEGIEKYHTTWNYREKDYPEKVLIKNKEIHIIELKKFEKYGEKDEELEIAKKMLELGDEIEKISVVTGLSKEEIEKLKDNK